MRVGQAANLLFIWSAGFWLAVVVHGDHQLMEDRHYRRHMAFRQEQSELRIEKWRNQLQQRRQLLKSQEQVHPEKETNPDDKQVLLDLYESTGGHGWDNNKGWVNRTTDPCAVPWAGVYCQNGRVVSIELVYNNMAGPLPQSLGKLTELQTLVFYSNLLTGTIPSALFSLSSLVELDLNSNQLSGTLPTRIDAKKLQSLVLYANMLQGEIPQQWDTPYLQHMELSSNAFTGRAPEAVGALTGLQDIVLSRNNLTGPFPPSWGDLHNLTQLWTFNNELRGPLPSSWSGMKSLTNVEMDGVTGAMPEWIGDWDKLTLLIISRGNMSGSLPASLCKLRQVQTLWLFQNALTGSLPSCLGQLAKCQQFEVSDNQLTGSIPPGVGEMQQVQYLYLSRNALSGELPSSLGGMKNLQIMDVSGNNLVGGVPESFNNLAGIMTDWALCYNKFSGPLTKTLAPLFKAISQFTCALYNNPWQCPIDSAVPKECDCSCDTCNTQAHRASCKECVATASNACGFCQDGSSCLHGDATGPSGDIRCNNWRYGAGSNCSALESTYHW